MKEDRRSRTAQAQPAIDPGQYRQEHLSRSHQSTSSTTRAEGLISFRVDIILFVVYVDLREGETEKIEASINYCIHLHLWSSFSTKVRKMV